jgi:hypothetical protein
MVQEIVKERPFQLFRERVCRLASCYRKGFQFLRTASGGFLCGAAWRRVGLAQALSVCAWLFYGGRASGISNWRSPWSFLSLPFAFALWWLASF